MKKLIFTLFVSMGIQAGLHAQLCVGQTATCTPTNLPAPGLSPLDDDLPAIVTGASATQIIQFKNYDQAEYPAGSGNMVTVYKLQVDSINNLPAGLCWVMDRANNTYNNQEPGCINIFGSTSAPLGQYKLKIKVKVQILNPNLPPNVPIDAEAVGLNYYVRVVAPGTALYPCIDTLAGAFKAYTGTEVQCPSTVGVNEIRISSSSLNIVPNPMNNNAIVSFVAEKTGVVKERLTNMLGSEVYNSEREVKEGDNKFSIDRNNLPVGVYFYTIGNGKSIATKRLVISE